MKQSNKKIFSAIFDRYYRKLYNYSFKVVKQKDVSEDLVQETFIKLWENITKNKPYSSLNRSLSYCYFEE